MRVVTAPTLQELAKISGITVRWATKDDGDFQRAPSERAVPGLVGFSREELPPPEPRYASLSNSATSTSSSDTQVKMEPLTPRQEESPIFANVNTPNGMHDPTYPHLRRFLVHTYRGRTLREDMTTGEPRYFDDSAIFVGKLVKQHETVQTLFERFARYGNIVSLKIIRGSGLIPTGRYRIQAWRVEWMYHIRSYSVPRAHCCAKSNPVRSEHYTLERANCDRTVQCHLDR